MSYLFNTPAQQAEMLAAIGRPDVESLFDQVPPELRLARPLDLPAPLGELELERTVRALAARNGGAGSRTCFLGGGAYDHFVPAVVDEIVSRGEFYTAYTPYQPEASQGSLQAFFEYQSLICALTGMDVSNASLYEGGTAVSEAVFMAMRATGRHARVVLLGSVHPEYRQVVETYLGHLEGEALVVPTPEGTADPGVLAEVLDDRVACVVIQQPNFFGCLEDLKALIDVVHRSGALAIVSCDPLSLGLLVRPGDLGADVVVAEGQPLGIPLQYGGPYLGVLACRQEFVRKMPGRLIGQTTDRHGRTCFVLNLQAREQHIRREKATSNICTNQGLLALRATAYLSVVGPHGLRAAADLCCRKAHYAAERLARVDGLSLAFDRPFFKEFVLKCRNGAESVLKRAAAAGLDVGPLLSRFPLDAAGLTAGLRDQGLLVAVTEQRTREDIDRLASVLAG